jgi:hypothetical protein
MKWEPPIKELKLTKPEHNGPSQLIPGVLRASRRATKTARMAMATEAA